jgi:hypothetical protein
VKNDALDQIVGCMREGDHVGSRCAAGTLEEVVAQCSRGRLW